MRTTDKTRTYRGEVLGLESPELLEYARYELSRHRQIRIRMSGSSMRPTIDDGDFVTIVPVEATALNPQDIVLMVTARRTALIHRVVSLQTRGRSLYALTRGDRSQCSDTPVPLTHIMGRVVSVQRKGKGKVMAVRRQPDLLARVRMWFVRLFGW